MGTTDETIGRNVKVLRDLMGLSQAQLAEAITEAGVPFYPQTVTKIEQGARSLKFIEGLELAKILGVEPGALYEPPTTARDDQEARRAISDLRAASSGMADLFWKLVTAESDLKHIDASSILSPNMRQQVRWAIERDGVEATLANLRPSEVDPSDPSDEALADMHHQHSDQDRMK